MTSSTTMALNLVSLVLRRGQRDSTFSYLLIPFLIYDLLPQFSPHLNFNICLQKVFLFVPIWRFKMVTNKSKSCSYCLLNSQQPHQKTKHLITHFKINSRLFLEGHLPLTTEQTGRFGNISQQKPHWCDGGSDQLVAVVGVFKASFSREMYSSVIITGHYIGGSVGLLWLSWETWHWFFMWVPKSRQPLRNADRSSPSAN